MRTYHVIGICLLSQSASEKHNQEKSPQTFAHLLHLLLHLPMCPPCLYNLVILTIGESWFLLLMRLGAAYWMLETETSLFELSEVFQ